MAFCNSCGAALNASTQFCNKCGAAAPVSTAVPVAGAPSASSSPAGAAPAQGSNLLKIVLIVVAAIVVLGIVGMGTMAYIVRRAVHGTRVEQSDGKTRVETPFGTVESNDNSEEAARHTGVDIYPGAKVLKGGASASFGSMHTVSSELESDDPPAKVAEFYRAQFPKANYVASDQDHYTIVASDKGNVTTINIEPEDGKTKIHIASITGKPGSN
jgi:hypothetical protein